MPDDDKPVDRRRFFRLGLAELLKPLSAAVTPLERAARHVASLENIGTSDQPRRVSLDVWLRPPGALPEKQFRETCSRCGNCVAVCPAKCIHIDASGNRGAGAPYIDVDSMACVVCDGLLCMGVCPSGALVPTGLPDIDMGTAVWYESSCVRSHGEDCNICVEHCPLGSAAIELVAGKVAVHPNGCIGCGVCQHDCPTSPKSIVVFPKAARGATA